MMATLGFKNLTITEESYLEQTAKYFDKRSSSYGGDHHRRSCREMLRLVSPTRPRILDLCGGTGLITIPALRQNPEAHVTIVDISPGMLSVAQQGIENMNALDRCTIIQDDVLAALSSMPKEKFDIAYCANALAYFAQPHSVVEHVYRVLTPANGIFCIQAPTYDSYVSSIALAKAVETVSQRNKNRFTREVFVRPHLNSKNPEVFCEFLRRGGFQTATVPSILELGGRSDIKELEESWESSVRNPLMSGVDSLSEEMREEVRKEWIAELEKRRGVDDLVGNPVHSMTAVAVKTAG